MSRASTPAPLRGLDGRRGRDYFSLDPAITHLNHGSYGATPTAALTFQDGLRRNMESNTLRWFENLPARHRAQREMLAPFVGAPVEELAMVHNASAAATAVFSSIPLTAGDEVLVTSHVYGAVAMGAARAARRAGAQFRTIPIPLAATDAQVCETVMDALTPRTRMLVVDHISSSTVRAFPVERLTELLADHGVVLVVDGAHALGILPRAAVRAPHVVWFGNLHKYPCAPRGSAVLVAQGEVADSLFPVIDSWGAEDPFPERFDQQGALDTTGFLSAAEAIRTLDEAFGWDTIREYSAQLGRYAISVIAPALGAIDGLDEAQSMRISGAGPRPAVGMPVAAQPSVRLPAGVATDGPAARALKDVLHERAGCEVGVSTWEGTGFIRISAHVYNEPADYDHFVDAAVPIIAECARAARA